jgi:hypothetical protein
VPSTRGGIRGADGAADAGFTALVHLALAVLLSRQVARSRTPAGLSRLSRWTFLAQAMVDAVSFAGVRRPRPRRPRAHADDGAQHVTFSILAEGHAAVSLLAPAFLAGLLFAYEMVCNARLCADTGRRD